MPGAQEQQATLHQPLTARTAAQPPVHGPWTASWLMAQASHQERKGKQSEKFNIAWHYGCALGQASSLQARTACVFNRVALDTGTVSNDEPRRLQQAKLLSNLQNLVPKHCKNPCRQLPGSFKSIARLACQKT